MKKFILGAVACYVIMRNSAKINKVLRDTTAKLELKQDMIRHDNPNVSN